MRLNIDSASYLLGLRRSRLFDLLGISTELRCWLEEKVMLDTELDQLPEEVNEKLVLVIGLVDEAMECFDGLLKARHWFNRRNMVLGGHKPKKIIFDGVKGIGRVRELIGQIRHGIYS